MEVEKMFDRFVTSKQAEGVSPRTVKWYSSHCRRFIAWHSDQADQELTTELMERFFVYLRTSPKLKDNWPGEHLSQNSIRSFYKTLRTFFAWCVDREILQRSPMKGIKVKRPEANTPKRVTREEVDRLLDSIPTTKWKDLRDRLIIHVLFFAGLRVGELVQLEAQHFDLERNLLFVPEGKTREGYVPLLPAVKDAFTAYQAIRPRGRTDRLFISVTARSNKEKWIREHGVRQMLYRRCRNAGLRQLNPHSFRHGIAMHLLNEKGADLYLIKAVLRHTRISITEEYYAKWATGPLVEAYFDRMID